MTPVGKAKKFQSELRIVEIIEQQKGSGMNLHRLSKETGVSYMTLHNIVKNKHNVSLVILESIANALGVHVKDLIKD